MPARKRIALLVNYLVGDYQMGLVRAVESATSASDTDLLVVVGRALAEPTPFDGAWNDIYERINGDTVDGVIVGSGCIGNFVGIEGLTHFCERFASLPRCSVSAQLPGIPSLVISNHRGMRVVVDHLIESHGCRHVACIRGPLGADEAQERFEGYLASLAEHGLDFDPDLVETGDFWVQTGALAVQRLLDRGKRFDAVVAANDYMALGAMDVLRSRNIRVPRDILVTGFDDVPSACIASPSLTTVRQPLRVLGQKAVEAIQRQIAGEAVPERLELNVELVRRQSCGCAYRVEPHRSSPIVSGPPSSALAELHLRRDDLRRRLQDCVRGATEALGDWPDRLLTALAEDLSTAQEHFLRALEDVLLQAEERGVMVDEFNAVVAVLRSHFRSALAYGPEVRRLEDVWLAATLLVGSAANRREVRARFGLENAQDVLRRSVERLSTALSHTALTDGLREVLPAARIRSASISLYEDPTRSTLRTFFVHGGGTRGDDRAFASTRLAPADFFRQDVRSSYFVMSVAFGTEHLGVAVFEAGAEPALYSMLREQIGAALKGAALHRAVVEETALRERAEREQLHKEMQIARQVQTAILPSTITVAGLELAAMMVPAADVGGDYYDVLPTETGCWIGVGDVTGHGLLASLVMMMIQSMVAVMVRADPRVSPSRIVIALNAALYDDVRHRLRRDEQATLSLLRYDRDGSLTFAGNHEEIVICRRRTGTCERIATPGLWVAAIPDVTEFTRDSRAHLEDGDLLVLFSDGVVEAMNPQRAQFGVERMCAIVDDHRARAPQQVCEAIIDAVRQWTASQRDDISVIVGRYAAPASS